MTPTRVARLAAWSLPALLALASTVWAQAPGKQDYLPDSTVLLRVNDHAVRVRDFVELYFEAWPEYRPQPDSLGRLQFLKQFENKSILGVVAREVNHPLEYEERQKLREWSQRAISNTLFQRLVTDSVSVTNEDIAALRREYSCEKHLQHIVFADLPTAQRVRDEMAAGKLSWKDAFARYNTKKDVAPLGDLGWLKRTSMVDGAETLFDIAPGQVSQPLLAADGYHVTRAIERRDAAPPQIAAFDHILKRQIRNDRVAARMERIQSKIREQIGLQFVDSNLVWVSSKFPTPQAPVDSTGMIRLRRVSTLPKFAPADTGRTLATWKNGRLSLEDLLDNYRETSSWVRQPLNTPTLLRQNVQNLVLEPYRWKLGVELGLDKDPMAVTLIEDKREQMLVDHLYQDSIMAKVRITPAERRKYYDKHMGEFLTYANAQYAVLSAGYTVRAESLVAVIKAGKPITQIMKEDSIRFRHSVGFVKKMTSEDRGNLYFHPVMEELKPGEMSIENIPDVGICVVQLQSFDPGRQLTYQEAEKYVDESLQNMAAQKLLDDLIARHRKRMKIELHPELVMKIRLVDPLEQS
jgi:PPIC-type peptidyl-prolyl cis-trans isomerase-like protein